MKEDRGKRVVTMNRASMDVCSPYVQTFRRNIYCRYCLYGRVRLSLTLSMPPSSMLDEARYRDTSVDLESTDELNAEPKTIAGRGMLRLSMKFQGTSFFFLSHYIDDKLSSFHGIRRLYSKVQYVGCVHSSYFERIRLRI